MTRRAPASPSTLPPAAALSARSSSWRRRPRERGGRRRRLPFRLKLTEASSAPWVRDVKSAYLSFSHALVVYGVHAARVFLPSTSQSQCILLKLSNQNTYTPGAGASLPPTGYRSQVSTFAPASVCGVFSAVDLRGLSHSSHPRKLRSESSMP